jgi:hypothetical protein
MISSSEISDTFTMIAVFAYLIEYNRQSQFTSISEAGAIADKNTNSS